MRNAEGRKLSSTIERLNPVLRGWSSYFKLNQSKRPLEEFEVHVQGEDVVVQRKA